jgi:4-amino-4-deoxychorismate lyase
MSLLVETIKVENGIPQNLSFHSERMIRSLYGIYGMKTQYDLEKLILVPESASSGIFKCRVLYDDKNATPEFLPYIKRSVRSLKLITDDYVCYPYKYIARDKINSLLEMRGACDDILIIKNGMVTDSSYANIIFMDINGNWVTPSTYLLSGTRRASLLHQGLITETKISSGEIHKYSEAKLINAMLGIDDTEGIPVGNIV